MLKNREVRRTAKSKFSLIGQTSLAKDIKIREYVNQSNTHRYFVATIRGFGGWYFKSQPLTKVAKEVWKIADKIDRGNKEIFYDKKYSKATIMK